MNNSFNIPAPIQVTITSTTLKKGKPDVKTFEAHLGIDEGKRTYVLCETKRDVDRMRFDLLPGCTITDESGTYTCNEVRYVPTIRKIRPVLIAS